jgi:hypothetical protein
MPPYHKIGKEFAIIRSYPTAAHCHDELAWLKNAFGHPGRNRSRCRWRHNYQSVPQYFPGSHTIYFYHEKDLAWFLLR